MAFVDPAKKSVFTKAYDYLNGTTRDFVNVALAIKEKLQSITSDVRPPSPEPKLNRITLIPSCKRYGMGKPYKGWVDPGPSYTAIARSKSSFSALSGQESHHGPYMTCTEACLRILNQ